MYEYVMYGMYVYMYILVCSFIERTNERTRTLMFINLFIAHHLLKTFTPLGGLLSLAYYVVYIVRYKYYVICNTFVVVWLYRSRFFFFGGVMCVLALRGFYNHISARFPLTTSKIIFYVDRVYINFNFNFYFASLLHFFPALRTLMPCI